MNFGVNKSTAIFRPEHNKLEVNSYNERDCEGYPVGGPALQKLSQERVVGKVEEQIEVLCKNVAELDSRVDALADALMDLNCGGRNETPHPQPLNLEDYLRLNNDRLAGIISNVNDLIAMTREKLGAIKLR